MVHFWILGVCSLYSGKTSSPRDSTWRREIKMLVCSVTLKSLSYSCMRLLQYVVGSQIGTTCWMVSLTRRIYEVEVSKEVGRRLSSYSSCHIYHCHGSQLYSLLLFRFFISCPSTPSIVLAFPVIIGSLSSPLPCPLYKQSHSSVTRLSDILCWLSSVPWIHRASLHLDI